MSSFLLKIIAIITMISDHVGKVFFPFCYYFTYIGRISFPLFAFQITNGYIHTHNITKYMIRLLLFAAISQIPFSLFLSTFSIAQIHTLNIFFTLLLGLFAIFLLDKIKNKIVSILLCILVAAFGEFMHVDYGAWGILVIALFYIFRNHKVGMILSYLSITLLKYIPYFLQSHFYYPNILLFAFTSISIVPILFYNGKQGKKMKYWFYGFYLLHLLLLYFLSTFLS